MMYLILVVYFSVIAKSVSSHRVERKGLKTIAHTSEPWVTKR